MSRLSAPSEGWIFPPSRQQAPWLRWGQPHAGGMVASYIPVEWSRFRLHASIFRVGKNAGRRAYPHELSPDPGLHQGV
jgi:hypothetical protein